MNTQIHSLRPVGFIGAKNAGGEEYRTAYNLAKLVAECGRPVITGGLGGVMEAACRGAMDAGGTSIALLPGMDATAANPYASIVLTTDLGTHDEHKSDSLKDYSRNRIIASASAFLVAISGREGTANEIKLALRFGKTVFAVRGAPYPEDVNSISPERIKNYRRMTTPDEAAAAIRTILTATLQG